MSNDNKIKTLEWDEHIRLRPGMYVGKQGDGSDADDGLYILLKETINNSIDEFRFGYGEDIIVNLDGNKLTVRDFGRGIDFDRLEHFKEKLVNSNDKTGFSHRTVGLDGVGLIVAIALSSESTITSYQGGRMMRITTVRGKVVTIDETQPTNEPDGLSVSFIPDSQIFENYKIRVDYIRNLLKIYSVCNPGMRLRFDNETFYAPDGMLSLANDISGITDGQKAIRIVDNLCDIAIISAINPGGGQIHSFVNGHPTIMGGPHVRALIDAVYADLKKLIPHRVLKCDIPADLIMCINILIKNPQFESCTKIKLASRDMCEGGKSIKQYIHELIGGNLPKLFDLNLDLERSFKRAFNWIDNS
ncbi:ATP-binding protein [Bacteroides sp.]|uniref:ATP-binding protein n=1 Tax=Bacteroides sp. TaxID=29523 RepID=UPI0023C180CA|nr:ATP-binding protein [Bacteroides sp.]MDE6214861.1 hypothetical protein [Bacteroides sp.]